MVQASSTQLGQNHTGWTGPWGPLLSCSDLWDPKSWFHPGLSLVRWIGQAPLWGYMEDLGRLPHGVWPSNGSDPKSPWRNFPGIQLLQVSNLLAKALCSKDLSNWNLGHTFLQMDDLPPTNPYIIYNLLDTQNAIDFRPEVEALLWMFEKSSSFSRSVGREASKCGLLYVWGEALSVVPIHPVLENWGLPGSKPWDRTPRSQHSRASASQGPLGQRVLRAQHTLSAAEAMLMAGAGSGPQGLPCVAAVPACPQLRHPTPRVLSHICLPSVTACLPRPEKLLNFIASWLLHM